jgi:hypothetical protein
MPGGVRACCFILRGPELTDVEQSLDIAACTTLGNPERENDLMHSKDNKPPGRVWPQAAKAADAVLKTSFAFLVELSTLCINATCEQDRVACFREICSGFQGTTWGHPVPLECRKTKPRPKQGITGLELCRRATKRTTAGET